LFNGENVLLRRLEESDLEHRVRWVNDPEVNRTLMFDWPLSLSETREWFRGTLFDRGRWDFTIVERATGRPVGMTGLINLDRRHGHAQFYVTIGEKPAWNRGYAGETVRLVLDFAFVELGLNKVYLYTLDDNDRARALYERSGFRPEAVMRSHFFIHGRHCDLHQHALLRDEHLAAAAAPAAGTVNA